MFNEYAPEEQRLRNRVEGRNKFGGEIHQQNIPAAAESTTGFAASAETAGSDAGGMNAGEMGGTFQGAAGVSKASGGSGAVTGALSGAAAGTAVMPGWGTAVGAAVGLAAGMFGDKAKQEELKRQRVIEAMKEEMRGKQLAARQLQQGTQTATSQILQGSARALS